MVNVPSARLFGFDLRLNTDVMREVLNSMGVRKELATQSAVVRAGVESHVRATASASSANNYVAALFDESADSDAYGFDFNGSYELGVRPIAVIGVTGGPGANPDAKPPLMVEAETHALTSQLGVTVGSNAEDIR